MVLLVQRYHSHGLTSWPLFDNFRSIISLSKITHYIWRDHTFNQRINSTETVEREVRQILKRGREGESAGWGCRDFANYDSIIQKSAKFWFFRKGSRASFSTTLFCVWFFENDISHVMFYSLTTFHCQIVFTSLDMYIVIICFQLITSLIFKIILCFSSRCSPTWPDQRSQDKNLNIRRTKRAFRVIGWKNFCFHRF